MKGKVSPLNPRSCIGCRSREDSVTLLRVVCIEGQLLPDTHRILPGRGAWVHVKCISKSIERGAFGRALRVNQNLDSSLLIAYIKDSQPLR
ncbi:MAG: YlxR family protein [Actinobacteria bacterium]|nr:YlxR family protein [Actinomycetota bacterium]